MKCRDELASPLLLSKEIMSDDPRIKRVLKRYRKGEDYFDASIDLSGLDLAELQLACRCQQDDSLIAPRELDSHALSYLSARMGLEFDGQQYDYFLHAYVRREFLRAYCDDPSVKSKASPEDGPPSKIPLPKGRRWISVRPKDGQEQYVAVEFKEPGSQ